MVHSIQGYDIIADIHGCADKLEALLDKLDYRYEDGTWCHPTRKVIFLGDYIDRGSQIRETLEIVSRMREKGSAICLMGNHEFNALAWATPDPHNPGQYLRPHTEQNRRQHAQTIEQLGGDYPDWIEWIKTLPLWLDLSCEGIPLHAIHACWSDVAMKSLREFETEKDCLLQGPLHAPTLTDTGLVYATQKGHPVFDAIELLLKGMEVELPAGHFMTDKDGHQRTNMRVQWWREPMGTYQTMAMVSETDRPSIPAIAMEATAFEPIEVTCPTFIGHYWLTIEKPIAPMSERVVCLDYSAVKGGPLVAYCFDVGDDQLTTERFVSVTDHEIQTKAPRPWVTKKINELTGELREELDHLKDR